MKRAIAGVALAILVVSGAQAEPVRRELSRVDLSGAPGMEVVTAITTYSKGDRVPSHFHNGVETGYVIQGTMIQRQGQAPSANKTGDPILNLRGVRHGDYVIVGDAPLILFTVHVVDKGKPIYDGIPPNSAAPPAR